MNNLNRLFLIKPTGIPNLGNTCFAAAFLQIFFSCKDFIKLIYNSSNRDQFILLYKSLIGDYYSNNINKKRLSDIYDMIGCQRLVVKGKTSNYRKHEDSPEYGLYFVKKIISTNIGGLLKLFGIDIVTQDIYPINSTKYREYPNGINEKLTRELQLEFVIPVPVNRKVNKVYNFEDLWNNYFGNEDILTTNGKIVKRKSILANDPKYMLINLKRSDPVTCQRLNNNVNNIWMKKKVLIDKYTPEQEFTDLNYINNRCFTSNSNPLRKNLQKINITYKLSAFTKHIGMTTSSGHWISYRLVNNKWYECNDNTIIEVEKDIVKLQLKQSSLLLYEKKKNKKI
jgi:hypothetical protein